MADSRSFDEIVNSFPGCKEELIEIYKKVSEVNEAFSKLDEKYPVDGWSWEIDLNRIDLYEEGFAKDPRLMNTAWTLVCKEDLETAQKRHEASLRRQRNCAHGNHEWIQVDGVKWCKFCGTLITKSFTLDDDGFVTTIPKIHYPESPHYLPKEEVKDEETNKEDKALDVDTQC